MALRKTKNKLLGTCSATQGHARGALHPEPTIAKTNTFPSHDLQAADDGGA